MAKVKQEPLDEVQVEGKNDSAGENCGSLSENSSPSVNTTKDSDTPPSKKAISDKEPRCLEEKKAKENIDSQVLPDLSSAKNEKVIDGQEVTPGNRGIINTSSQCSEQTHTGVNDKLLSNSCLTSDSNICHKTETVGGRRKHVPMVYIKPEPAPDEEVIQREKSLVEHNESEVHPSSSNQIRTEERKLAKTDNARKVPAQTLPKPILEKVKQEPGVGEEVAEKMNTVRTEGQSEIEETQMEMANIKQTVLNESVMIRVKKEPADTTEESTADVNSDKSKTDDQEANDKDSANTKSKMSTAENGNAGTTEPTNQLPVGEFSSHVQSGTEAATIEKTVTDSDSHSKVPSDDRDQNKEIQDQQNQETGNNSPCNESGTLETIPDDFFDDIIDNAEQLTDALTEGGLAEDRQNDITPSSSSTKTQLAGGLLTSIRVKNEPKHHMEEDNRMELNAEQIDDSANLLPNNFFDDLLVDHVEERLARIAREAEEIKYSEQLKRIKERLRQLDDDEEREHQNNQVRNERSHDDDDGDDDDDAKRKKKKHEGHKHKDKKSKSKKKKHKRERIENDERESVPSLAVRNLHQVEENQKDRKRKRDHSELEYAPNDINHNYGSLAKVSAIPAGHLNYGSLPKTCKLKIPEESKAAINAIEIRDYNHISTKFQEPVVVKVEKPWPSADDEMTGVKGEQEELECLPVAESLRKNNADNFTGFKRIKLEKPDPANMQTASEPAVMTPAMKRQRALILAAEALQRFHSEDNDQPTSFQFVSTVRKIPPSTVKSVVSQRAYEHRSPLHAINNVRYSFNSISTRINLNEWGLEAIPKTAAKVARILGYDAETLLTKIQAANLKNKYNVKFESVGDKVATGDNGETVDETQSSFFTNAMTQTEDAYDHLLSQRRRNTHSIGIQAIPMGLKSKSTQTAAGLPLSSNEDLPLMSILKVLNENQLLALNDFAELINEPASSAIDMYRLRTRMLEIYKCSQMPSAMPVPPSAPIHPTIYNHSSGHLNAMEHEEFLQHGQNSSAQFNHSSTLYNMQQLQLQQQQQHQRHQQQHQQQPQFFPQPEQHHHHQQSQPSQPPSLSQHRSIPSLPSRDPRSSALRAHYDPRLAASVPRSTQHQYNQLPIISSVRSISQDQCPPSSVAEGAPPRKSYGRGSLKR